MVGGVKPWTSHQFIAGSHWKTNNPSHFYSSKSPWVHAGWSRSTRTESMQAHRAHANSIQKALGNKPATFWLWADCAHHCTTVSPFPPDLMKSSFPTLTLRLQTLHPFYTYLSWSLYGITQQSQEACSKVAHMLKLNLWPTHLLASTYRALASPSRALMATSNNRLLRAGDETSIVPSCVRKCWNSTWRQSTYKLSKAFPVTGVVVDRCTITKIIFWVKEH